MAHAMKFRSTDSSASHKSFEKEPIIQRLVSGGGTFDAPPLEGLTTKEARARLEADGPNVLEPKGKEPFLSILLTQMKNMIFLLTTCASIICHLMGDEVKAYVLLGIVGFVCTVNAVGEYSGQDAGAALAQMSSETALAIRDGYDTSVPARELVVGDVVRLHMGDMVPADMVVLESVDLQTNESVLTGESHEKLKTLEPTETDAPFQSNMLFSATSVVSGFGKGEIVATGMRTQVGLIAKRLTTAAKADMEVNPLQKSINFLGLVIGVACCGIIIVATSVSFFTGYQNPMEPCPDDDDLCLLMTSAARGLIMAVSLIPHGLPFVVMIMLRVGSTEMAARHAVVTRRSAVDYLGATTVICSDKTGTLTEGKMTAQALMGFCRPDSSESAQAKESSLEFYPLRGLSPNGGLFSERILGDEAKRRMDARFDLRVRRQSFAEPGLPDLSDRESVGPDADGSDAMMARAHLACGFLNCYGTEVQRDESTGGWITKGNMTEAAVKVAAAKGGLWDEEGVGFDMLCTTHAREAALEVPFTSKRKMMATLHGLPQDGRLETLQFPSGSTHFAILKGAPDQLLPSVSAVLCMGKGSLSVPGGAMSNAERDAITKANGDLARRALRSLLVAVCPLDESEVIAIASAESVDDRLDLLKASNKLCFLSLWGIYDPPRPAVQNSVNECHTAGIQVVMITGDQLPTAQAIGKQVNIIREGEDADRVTSLCSKLHKPIALRTPSAALSRTPSAALSRLAHQLMEQQAETPSTSSEVSVRTLGPRVMTGRDLVKHVEQATKAAQDGPSYLPDDLLASLTGRVHIWGRAQPSDKVTIVDSLKGQGHIVAMTGDGVNDAPALKRADVGVAMGISGTSVSKNASDLVLMDDNFSTIVAAVREGRRIYSNTQKYVCFNLSIKAGECTCLMMAIALGVPMPIRGLQLLFNLVVTHIIPPISLAWEKAEPYIMTIPPRDTKHDVVVSRLMWICRWLPFVICMPTVVLSCLTVGVWTHTGFVKGNLLIGSSRVDALARGAAACEFAGVLDSKGRFIDDPRPFHCVCNAHLDGVPWSKVTLVDQWGRDVPDTELERSFDRWSGWTGDLFQQAHTPWSAGAGAYLESCKDHRGVMRWCWKDKGSRLEERPPLLPQQQNCAAYGAQLGQTMAYVAIHVGEILTLLVFRTDCILLGLFTNRVYSGMFVFNIIMLSVFLYVRPITDLLQLTPLSPARMAVALCFAVMLMFLNTLVKIEYRRRLEIRNAAWALVAERRSWGCAPPPEDNDV